MYAFVFQFFTITIEQCSMSKRRNSLRCNSVSSNSSNVGSISKPAYPVVSSSDSVINISKSLKFTPTN